MLEPRLVAQIAAQLLKETEDLTHRGDFMVSMKAEKRIRDQNAGELPIAYRYHLNRIADAVELACIIIESSVQGIQARETYHRRKTNAAGQLIGSKGGR